MNTSIGRGSKTLDPQRSTPTRIVTDQPVDPLIGRVIAGRYQILALIGVGGMGRVYMAEHVRMLRKCAVKVMNPDLALAADAVGRFNREAANAARVNHPNVAQVFDFGETEDGMLYLAMEYVEGETLRTIVAREAPLPLDRAADLTLQIADALAPAHHLGIVHRDLKPDNVLVTRQHDGVELVKVVDFGIAKTVQREPGEASQTITTAGVSLGTPDYMSPEQLASEQLDSRSDLYALGLVLFNMLTGSQPYPPITSKETLIRRLTSKPMSLADAMPNADWPPALQSALDRALAPNAVDRYATVTEFAQDVTIAAAQRNTETLRDTQPMLEAPIPMTEDSSSRWAQMIAAAALFLVVGIGAGTLILNKRPPAKAAASPVKPAPRPRPDTGAALLVQEIRAHAKRASALFGKGNAAGARAEVREMEGKTQTLRRVYPAVADSLLIETQARGGFQRPPPS
jgi:serine/threonine-protein kinase